MIETAVRIALAKARFLQKLGLKATIASVRSSKRRSTSRGRGMGQQEGCWYWSVSFASTPVISTLYMLLAIKEGNDLQICNG
jgi:hypothetical protein